MQIEDLLALTAARRGHFVFESGHHGDVWLDLDRLFTQPGALRPFVVEVAGRFAAYRVDAVCGPLTGGAFLAQLLAAELGVLFCFAERVTLATTDGPQSMRYRLPDGLRQLVRGKVVGVVDDAINAGWAVRETISELRAGGARVAVIGALLAAEDAAMMVGVAEGVPLECLAVLPGSRWAPLECPLCLKGAPLTSH